MPSSWAVERQWIWSVLFEDFLELTCEVQAAEVSTTTITAPGQPGTVECPEGFFRLADADWRTPGSLPPSPVPRLDASGGEPLPEGMPRDIAALYGARADERSAFSLSPRTAQLHFDLAGSAFVLLSRYEEAVRDERDEHGRFPASASSSGRAGLLHRPLVNEYAEVLDRCLRHCWPQLPRPRRAYRVLPSHDVDSVLFHLGSTTRRLLRALAGDLLHRRDPALAVRRLRSLGPARRGEHRFDPHDTFDYLMDVSDRHGLRSAFYFMAGGDTRYDAVYDLDMPWVRSLLRRIGERGHEVGVHPSYDSHRDGRQVKDQFRALRDAAESCGVQQNAWGGRQHFLRWEAGSTWSHWADAGLSYDSSLGYAEIAGFRTGSCFEYRTFDAVSRTPLPLRERPLILMETTLISPRYMGASPEQRLHVASELAAACRRHRGDLTLLWHNSKVISRAQRREYEAILARALE